MEELREVPDYGVEIEDMRYTTLPYDYARCMSRDCPKEQTCMRKTPGRETYQTMFAPTPSKDCAYFIYKEVDEPTR